MAEILYRSDEHRFSVYRVEDVPDGVLSSGWEYIRADRIATFRREHSAYFSTREHFRPGTCCAVLDEHAGPLLSPRFTVGMRVRQSEDGHAVYGMGLRSGRVISVKPCIASGIGLVLEVLIDGQERPFPYGERMWEPEPVTALLATGQRVRLSARGREIYHALWTGVVTAPPSAHHVEVMRDDNRATMPYEAAMWEPEPAVPVHNIDPTIAYYLEGASSGERRIDYGAKVDGVLVRDSVKIRAASGEWSRSVRVRVRQSDEESKRREDERVGWDPYGDDL